MLTTGQDSQQLINSAQATARYNNQWSAEQAQKQMDFQTASNAKAMKFSADQSKMQRDWEENMANTAHQREVKDLIAAGLNPILSVNKGAPTPQVSSAQGVASAGSKGDTDTGMTSLFNGMIQALISQATALNTTSMNNQTSLLATKMMNETAIKTGQIGASALLGTANINSMTQFGLQQNLQAFEERMKRNYPSNVVTAISSVLQQLKELSANEPNSKGALVDAITKAVQEMEKTKPKDGKSW